LGGRANLFDFAVLDQHRCRRKHIAGSWIEQMRGFN
jgi:hypothetical protein